MAWAALVVGAAFALAAFTYLGLERTGRRGWIPLVCRGVAWSALGLLLLNISRPKAGRPGRPIVLLDASLSMSAPGAQWTAALDSARRLGEVRRFGDARSGIKVDSGPALGRSLLGPALIAATAAGRPVVVFTDGEIEDRADLPPDLLARARVRVLPRSPRPDVAITRVDGPARVTAGDTITLEIETRTIGGADSGAQGPLRIEVTAGTRRVGAGILRTAAAGGQLRIRIPSQQLRPGDQLLRIALAGATHGEPRTDARLHLVTVTPTPGIVLIASQGDWDSRFLFHTLRDVAALPVRGYVQLAPGRWRSMADLASVPADRVRQAARGADLLILKGDARAIGTGSYPRGIWRWPSGQTGAPAVPGDWYLSAEPQSPLAGAFLGQPLDSFPPAVQIGPAEPSRGDWIGLTARLGRRGAPRPVLYGREQGRTRLVVTQADGLWRWAFRGGSSQESYRSLVAAATSWLLGGADSLTGAARPIRPVVANGLPVVFEWTGRGAPVPTAIVASGGPAPQRARADTLLFDGEGRAQLWLPPGDYRYRLAGGGAGTIAVEAYSDELLPRPIALASHAGRWDGAGGRTAARDWLWLFGLCVLALSAEWLARRRLGLR